MRLAERLRPGRQTLQPALPSRFEPAKTGAAPETFWREANESFAVVDEESVDNSSAARLIPHSVARQTSFSEDDTVGQREYGSSTPRVAAQIPRPIQDPEEPLAETKQLIEHDQPLPASPTNNRPPVGTGILNRVRLIRGNSPSLVVRGSRIEPREEGVAEKPMTPARSTEEKQIVLSQSTRRRIAPEDESLRSPAALEPSQLIQPREEGPKHESETGTRRAARKLQQERERPDNFPPAKSALVRGELVPWPASFGNRKESPEQDEARGSLASPEIRVTIGRIEVRVITPPATSQSSAAPRVPKISLDDYLRSRKGTAA